MKPWYAWLHSLGLSGICLVGFGGCGGGDVPDASDAGQEVAGDAPSEPAAPPAAAAPAAAPAPAVVVAPGPGAAPAFAPEAAGESVEAATTDAPAGKAEPNSATAEMLAIATGGNQPPAEAEGAAGGGRPGQPGPGGMMMGGGMMPPMGPPGGQSQGSASQMEMMARMGPRGTGPGGPGGPNSPDAMAGMMAAQAKAMQGAGGPGGFGGPGGPGGMAGLAGAYGPGGAAGGRAEAGDTTSPEGAVKAFLSALEAKDRDRLMEATALRATSAQEGGKYRDMFSRIIDSSISDSELSELSSRLEGFKVSGANPPKSTGSLGVTVKKTEPGGGWLQRTFTVRKEKKGWGVLDISAQSEFHGNGRRNVNQGGKR